MRERQNVPRKLQSQPAVPVWGWVAIGGGILFGLLCLVALGVALVGKSNPAKTEIEPKIAEKPGEKEIEKPSKTPAKIRPIEIAFGEKVSRGDQRISITAATNEHGAGGEYRGQFRTIKLMRIHLSVENTSKGKIAQWEGWQGKAKIEDEHGNEYSPIDLRGWRYLPNNDTFGDGWDGDTGSRVHPGKTYINMLYYQHAPFTSKEIVVSIDIDGQPYRFRGRLNHPGFK